MPTELNLEKLPGNLFRPATQQDAEKAQKVKVGKILRGTWTQRRNEKFFKKWWALINYAYECWEPDDQYEKNLDQFRKNITIRAGFYEQAYNIDGTISTLAKSISWAKMSEDEFEKLYSASINVIIKYILKNYTASDLSAVLENINRFC